MAQNGMLYVRNNTTEVTGVGVNGRYLRSSGVVDDPIFSELPAGLCSFLAIKTSSQNVAATETSAITFGTEVYDSGSNFASNVFTAPTSGRIYMFNVQVYATNASVMDQISLIVNGLPRAISQMAMVLGELGVINISIPLILAQGDIVGITYTNSDQVLEAVISGQAIPYNTWFSGYQLT